MDQIKIFFNLLLDFVFPRYCIFCGQIGKNICKDCINSRFNYRGLQSCPYCEGVLPKGKFIHKICAKHCSINGIFVTLNYEKHIKKAIWSLKYHFHEDLAYDLSKIIQLKLSSLKIKVDYIVPVPLHNSRKKWRGFNQCEALSKHLNILSINVLEKIKKTKPQAKLSRINRLLNMQGAFQVTPGIDVNGFSYLLIDDVVTTRATLESCALALKSKGAKSVYGLVLAKDTRDL